MDCRDLADLVNILPRRGTQPLTPNHLIEVWGRWLIVKRPKRTLLRHANEPSFLDAPTRQKVPYTDQIPHPPKWGEEYRLKPGPKSGRPSWCPEKAWATAQKRKQRGAPITDDMLREIITKQAAKAKAAKASR